MTKPSWTPVTWQGWAVIGLFLAIVLGGAALSTSAQSEIALLRFLNSVVASLLMLVGLSMQKGPVPKWRSGKLSSDSTEEYY